MNNNPVTSFALIALLCGLPLAWGAVPAGGMGPSSQGPSDQAPAAPDPYPAMLHLSARQLKYLHIRLAKAAAADAETHVSLPATVAFDADRVAKIGPRLRAKVVRVTKDLGARVTGGDIVAVMDSVDLGKAKAGYLTAKARLATERAAYRREQRLAKQNISSEAALLEARARYRQAQARFDATREELRLYGMTVKAIGAIKAGARTPLSRFELRSPVEGIVQTRDLSPGQTVGPDQTPIEVVDTRRMWVMIDAYERDLPVLRRGQAVALTQRALPDLRFTGRINWISRKLDPRSRTIAVRAVVSNPDGLLRAGMYGTASIRIPGGGRAVRVPVGAVQRLKGRPVVFVPGKGSGDYRVVPVLLGREFASNVEVVSGLQPGQAVVADGSYDLMSILTSGSRAGSAGE